jgi:hypothetical protein
MSRVVDRSIAPPARFLASSGILVGQRHRRIPLRLKPLQDRLLDHAIDHGWNAEVARPAGWFRDSHPTHRLRRVAPLEQLFFDLRPARFEDARQPSDGDPVDAGAPLLRTTERNAASMLSGSQIASIRCAVDARLSGSAVAVTASTSCTSRHGVSPRQGQLELVWRSRCSHERSDLLALSFNHLSGTVRAFGQRAGLLCPLLTSALWSGRLTTSSVPKDTVQISRSKPDSLRRTPAGFTVLDLVPARPTSAASYPVSVRRVATLLHAAFRQFLAVLPLRFASASPPSGCTGDLHPQNCRTCPTHRTRRAGSAGAAAFAATSLTAAVRGALPEGRSGRRDRAADRTNGCCY